MSRQPLLSSSQGLDGRIILLIISRWRHGLGQPGRRG